MVVGGIGKLEGAKERETQRRRGAKGASGMGLPATVRARFQFDAVRDGAFANLLGELAGGKDGFLLGLSFKAGVQLAFGQVDYLIGQSAVFGGGFAGRGDEQGSAFGDGLPVPHYRGAGDEAHGGASALRV